MRAITTFAGRGNGEQVTLTPRWLVDRVQEEWGPIIHDAAALPDNAVVGSHYSPLESALDRDWPRGGIVWCNPPFRMFAEFTRKAAEQRLRDVETVMLAIASISTNWWAGSVHDIASVYPIPRIRFVGHEGLFPKDLVLLRYGRDVPRYHRRLEWRENSDS